LNEVVEQVFPRPPRIPDDVSNQDIIAVVRAFLYGERFDVCATMLKVDHNNFLAITRGSHWRDLQNQFRDEFLQTTGNRLVRLEQKVLDKIEKYLDDGVEAVGFNKDGPVNYTRDLSPREAAVIARTLAETNKRIDKIREGDVSRKKFDFAERLRSLERAANAKVIEGERAA
jgi:hypothetical protein